MITAMTAVWQKMTEKGGFEMAKTEAMYVHGSYGDIMKLDKDSAADRIRAASIVMRHCGDTEMADTLSVLSGQLDFGDSMEAADAIGRTQAKLDRLIKDRRTHRQQDYIHMLTGDWVRAMAGGEVTDVSYSFIKSSYLKGGSFDPDIFGGSGAIPVTENSSDRLDTGCFGTGMGCITLPCHVILPRDYHIAAWLLDMTVDDVEKIAKCVAYAVVDPGNTDLRKGQAVHEKDRGKYQGDAVLMCGGDAIHHLLRGLGYSDMPERIAFDVIPVPAPIIRPMFYCSGTGTFHAHPLNGEYNRVLNRAKRIRKLREMGAPEIIDRNECRMLGECVKSLMDRVSEALLSTKKGRGSMNGFRMFAINQLSMARMKDVFSARTIKPVKTGEIRGLGIYPETVLVMQDDGTTSDMDLEAVYDACLEAIGQARTDNAVVVPDGCDPDNLPPGLQEEADRAEEMVDNMEDMLDRILEGAKEQRESFTVRLSGNGMYVPC